MRTMMSLWKCHLQHNDGWAITVLGTSVYIFKFQQFWKEKRQKIRCRKFSFKEFFSAVTWRIIGSRQSIFAILDYNTTYVLTDTPYANFRRRSVRTWNKNRAISAPPPMTPFLFYKVFALCRGPSVVLHEF